LVSRLGTETQGLVPRFVKIEHSNICAIIYGSSGCFAGDEKSPVSCMRQTKTKNR
jgi:hypothetical protein